MLFASASLIGLVAGTSYALAASAVALPGQAALPSGGVNIVTVADTATPSAAIADPATAQALHLAQAALERRQTAAAADALERAETRMLDRAAPSGAVAQADTRPVINDINQARQALRRGDITTASRLVAQALAANQADGSNVVMSSTTESNAPFAAQATQPGSPQVGLPAPPQGVDPAIWRAITTGQGSPYGVDAVTWQEIAGSGGGG